MENSNSPPTGDLTPLAEHTRKIVGSIPTPQPMSLPTTLPTGKENPSAETLPAGSSAGKSGAVVTAPGRWEVQQFGPFNLPVETTRSLTSSLASRLVIQTTSQYGLDGQFEGLRLEPFRIKPGLPRGDIGQCLEAIDDACRPAAKRDIAPIVAVLRARTKSRVAGEGEARFMAETMLHDLAAYPLDVAEFACNYWVNGGKAATFFPSWPELKEICDKRMDGRLRLKRALIHAMGEAQ